MKCFFCLSSKGQTDDYNEMAIALAESARVNSTLQMYCVYDGGPNALTNTLQELGVTVCLHKPSYTDFLEECAQNKSINCHGRWVNSSTWNGTFLRLEIPLLVKQMGFSDKYVLYVDTDCFILNDPLIDQLSPEFLAAAPEKNPNDVSYFNCGVMLLNVESMMESYPSLIQYCKDHQFKPKEGVVDQGFYNLFYKKRWAPLDPKYNWKAYWPLNPHASIIHFHGPNPRQIEENLKNGQPFPSKSMRELLSKNMDHLRANLEIWNKYLKLPRVPCV